MTDSWGDDVPVTEQEDLTFISKSTFWRVGHDLFYFANKVEGMDWRDVWLALTGEAVQFKPSQRSETLIFKWTLWNCSILEISLHVRMCTGFKPWHDC